MAINGSTLADEDGDFSDWIEVRNSGVGVVDLAGWTVTDDVAAPGKWGFPAISLAAGERLVVFASGKDRVVAGAPLHTNFQLSGGGEYLALVEPGGVVAVEFAPEYPEQYEDISYGPGMAGSVTATGITPVVPVAGTHYSNVYVNAGGGGTGQTSGTLNNLVTGAGGASQQRYLWLNFASELGRIPAGEFVTGATLNWEGNATSGLADIGVFTVPVGGMGAEAVFPTSQGAEMVDYFGANAPVAVAGVLALGTQVLNWDVTDLVASWVTGPGEPQRGEFMLLNSAAPSRMQWMSNVPTLTVQTSNAPPGGLAPIYFEAATPGAAESGGVSGFVKDTKFNVNRGYYTEAQRVEITTATPGASVYYTDDGLVPISSSGVPTATAILYTDPVLVSETTVIRAAAVRDGWEPTNVDSNTYVIPDSVATQTQPEGYPRSWTGEPRADYAMDATITNGEIYTERFREGLRSIPTVSVAGDKDAFFGPRGIYSDTQNRRLEVSISAEFFVPDGTADGVNVEEGFQIDCGMKLQGGASRNPSSSIKHSLSLRFRAQYGEGTLKYPLYPESEVDRFDSLHLRAGYNNSWIHRDSGQRQRATMIRDQWMRDSMIATGNPDGGRGRYVNLYINGLYWGVYGLHERLENDHYAAYAGVPAEEVFGFNPGRPSRQEQAAFNAMKAEVNSRDWGRIRAALDVDSYIDYFILEQFGRNADLKNNGNWRAAGGDPRAGGAPWRFYCWDSERVFEDEANVSALSNSGGADGALISTSLENVLEFRVRFADRAWKHLTHGGALSNERNRARFEARVAELDLAIIGESARWGDDRESRDYTRDRHWLNAINGPLTTTPRRGVLGSWFPETGRNRTDRIITAWTSDARNGRWRSGDFRLLNTDAPEFTVNGVEQHGGRLTPGQVLDATAAEGAVFYTTDGSDPRLEGGAVAGTATPLGASIPLVATTQVRMRAKDGDEWSPLVEATFATGIAADATNTVVSEIHYHPADPTAEELANPAVSSESDFEFVELMNLSSGEVDLSGVAFTAGIDVTVPAGTTFGVGERVVLVRNAAAFALRYGGLDPAPVMVAEYGGKLSNSGDTMVVVTETGEDLARFRYNDKAPWPESADGAGYSLTMACPYSSSEHARAKVWRSSAATGGTPGYGICVGYDEWKVANGVTGGELDDDDGDGNLNIVEMGLGDVPVVSGEVRRFSANGVEGLYGAVRFRRVLGVDVMVRVEESTDLVNWTVAEESGQVESVENTGDGMEEVVVRSGTVYQPGVERYFRIVVEGARPRI